MDFSNEDRNLQIANYLQTLRLEQNLTLEQLSNLSQVPIVHLMSIEEGRFLRFDDFYLKMYLKRYTQSLDVDLEQLYTYASQQPLIDSSENAADMKNANERQMTETQASISATPKNIANTKPQRKKPTVKTANISRLEAKKKVGKFIIGLTFILLLLAIVIFMIIIIRGLGGSETPQTDQPPIDNPHNITPSTPDNDYTDEDIDEDTDEETEPETEPEPETTIELDSYTGGSQTFNVTTTLEEIEFIVEFSENCWLELRFNNTIITSGTYNTNTVLEEIAELVGDGSDILHLNVGNLRGIESINFNGVEVDFDGGHFVHRLYFNITLDSE